VLSVTRQRRLSWRLVGLAMVLAVVAMIAPAQTGEAHTCTPDPEIGVRGHLLLPSGSGVSEVELPSRAARQIAVTPAQGLATAVARSADGSQLAITRFWRPPDQRVGGQDILLIGADGGAPIATIERGQPGEALGVPSWLPDGSVVFERRQLSGATEAVQIDRARPGEPAERLATGAAWPATSPDGSLLAMTHPSDQSDRGDRLVVRPVEGGPERVLVDGSQQLAIAFPRFSPDGAWIAFEGASGSPAAAAPLTQSVARLDPLFSVVLRLGTPVAFAHGIPWDVYMVRPDGTDQRRVTAFLDDDASLAWSPDGRWLVTFSAEALHAIAVEGAANFCISNVGGYGGIEWLP
jgi:Tol biopolymer transport system component